MRWPITPKLIFVVLVDGLHEQTLDLWQGEGFFRKGVKFGFAQHLRQRDYTLHSGSTSNQPVRPFPAVTLFIVDGTVFKLLCVGAVRACARFLLSQLPVRGWFSVLP